MMLMTVTERTREIGLRKAIGAKKKDISLEFLTEAVALTLVSGIFGVILAGGFLAGYLLWIHPNAGDLVLGSSGLWRFRLDRNFVRLLPGPPGGRT